MNKIKRCAFCNKEFKPNSNKQIYCKGPHYHTCPVCGKQVEVTNVEKLKFPPTACSYQCRAARTRQTSLAKYQCLAPGNSEQARRKARETCMKNHGVEYAMQSPEIRAKSAATNIEKYGCDNPGKNQEIINKRMKTNRKRYGDTMPFNTPECYAKQHQTMIKKYGVPYFPMSQEFIENHTARISKINKQFMERLDMMNIKYCPELGLGTKIYDIALIDRKIAIEINPTYTHNSFGNHWEPNGIAGDYHLNKTKIAEENGYKCIHVWDWDDWDKVLNLLANKEKLDVNNLVIYKLTESSTREFMNANHIDGYDNNTVFSLGLVASNQIYQAITFARSKDNQHCAELSRLATLKGYEILGGFKKLFNYATHEFGLSSIVAYSDLSKQLDDTLEQAGMTQIATLPPREIWSRGKEKIIRKRKSHTRTRSKLIEDGWLPVYDCGQAVYEYI